MQKIKDLPDDYKAPVSSVRFRGFKKVLIKGPAGVWFGWEAKDGTLHQGALVEPSEGRKKEKEQNALFIEKRRAAIRQKQVSLDDLRRRREAGGQMSSKDLNTLADLLLGRL